MPGYVSRESADRWNRTAQIVAGGGAGSFTSPVPFADSGAEPLLFKNVSGETIPPFACVQLTGTTESGTHTNLLNADQPADAHGHSGPYAFNGPSSVAAGEIGTLQSGPAYRAIYNSGTQTAGIKYHPIKDSWEIKGAGFGTGSGIWSYVGTDDIIADTIRVKSCAAGETVCQELGDLAPGTYRGISGATTAPGETGPVIVTGCNGDVTIDAVNHSNCTFYIGQRITAHISPCCTASFDGCSCCEVLDCCERSIAICIAGEQQILPVDGGTYTWDISEVCNCEGAELEVTLSCTPGSGSGQGQGPGPGGNSTIEADWTYTCGETTSSGTIDIASLCVDDADVEIIDQLDALCDGYLLDRWANFVEDCATVTDPCCFCATYDGAAADTVGGLIGPNIAVSIEMDKTTWCNGDTVSYTINCTNNAGVSLDIRPNLIFGTAGSITASSCGRYTVVSSVPTLNTNVAVAQPGTCERDNPATINWADVTVAAGETISRTATVNWTEVSEADGTGGSTPAKISAYFVILSGTGNFRASTRSCTAAVRCGNASAGGGDDGAPGPGGA